MEISEHAIQRYVKRVMGINDGNKAKEYACHHRYEVAYKILDLFNKSSVLHINYAPTRGETLDYYINGEILLVVNTKNNELSTMYQVALGNDKLKFFVDKIKKNNSLIKAINLQKEKQDEISDHLKYMINRLQGKVENALIESFQKEYEESVAKCKEYAAETKRLRLENRDMMTDIFRKKERQK